MRRWKLSQGIAIFLKLVSSRLHVTQAIVIEQYGGPEVLQVQDVPVAGPDDGQVKLLQTRIGVNFHDVYVRSGLYRTLALPGIPGIEAAGTVIELGSRVTRWKVGDRVAYVTGAYGVYARERLIDADMLLPVPDDVSDATAASVLLRGMTVDMLVNRVHKVLRGDIVLVQAAGGGVGQMLCQWLTHLGAMVIGTAGGDNQERRARMAGCQHVIRYREQSVAEEVRKLTDGRGVDVAYDGVGKDTFQESLASLAYLGHLVNFGQASGMVPPIEVAGLAAKSNSLSRPIIFHYVRNSESRRQMTESVFAALLQGWLSVDAPREFALVDAPESHREIESSGASKPLLLLP